MAPPRQNYQVPPQLHQPVQWPANVRKQERRRFWGFVSLVGAVISLLGLAMAHPQHSGFANRIGYEKIGPTTTTVIGSTVTTTVTPSTIAQASTAPVVVTTPPTTSAPQQIVAPPVTVAAAQVNVLPSVTVRGMTFDNCPNPSQDGIKRVNDFMGPPNAQWSRKQVCGS